LHKRFSASRYVVEVDHYPVQVPARGQFNCTGGILAELKGSPILAQTSANVCQNGGVSRENQTLQTHFAILREILIGAVMTDVHDTNGGLAWAF
jgi:hypothetical protein